jgi:hypothetical protein
MKLQLEISKIVAIVLYRFVHALNPKHMSNTFDVGASIIHKYVDIIGDVLCGNKFFGKYINTALKDHLLHIIQQFQEFPNLSNICGAINDTHIALVKRPSRRQFYNIKLLQ